MGPAVRATEDPPRSPRTSRHLTSPLTVRRELRRCRFAWRSPPTRSHGGSQGFKSPHLHPKLAGQSVASAERRRSLHVAAALRPQAQVAVQPRRLAATRRLGPGPHTMTTERGHHLATHPGAPLPTGDPRAHSPFPGRPRGRPSHCPTTPPTTTAKSKPTPPWPSTACASLERSVPTRANDEPVMDTPPTTPPPAIPARRLPAPHRRPPRPHSDRTERTREHTDTGRRTLNTGRRAPGRSDARTGHWTPVA
jgi:hypothetical protein